jgi:magnesium transporter
VPTLIASFLGMNVKVPFEEETTGFYVAIVLSVLAATAMVLYFNKKKWF